MRIGLKTLVVFLLLFCFSCVDKKKNYEDCHHYMTIINHSDLVIYATESYLYPDTVNFYKYIPNPSYQPYLNKVNPEGENTDAVENLKGCLEGLFNEPHIGSGDTMMVFLFREDSLKANDWKDAPNYVLKRYDLTIDELNALNWTITYP